MVLVMSVRPSECWSCLSVHPLFNQTVAEDAISTKITPRETSQNKDKL